MKNNFRKKLLIGLISISSFGFVGYSALDDNGDFELIKNLEIFHSLMKEIRISYVDEPQSEKLIHTAIDKMLESMDPYTVYYPESLIEDARFEHTGEYAGIGIMVSNNSQGKKIMSITEDSPAQKSDIQLGDIVLKINNQDVRDLSHEQCSQIMKGEPGTFVTLTIKRAENILTKQIERKIIQIKDVSYFNNIDNIGYIKLEGFTDKSYQEFKQAFSTLKQNNKINKLIIDLRDNPGGLLTMAVDIVNLFVKKNENIVEMKSRIETQNHVFSANNSPMDINIPIVCIINENSASAAEILSGSLQDLDRAVIVGQKSFGKGLVQTTKDLAYNSKLKITIAKYYIPSGRCIQKLDYSHKDSLGKATRIQDDKSQVFKTKNGREVLQAGGITPDIIIEEANNFDKITYLYKKETFFDFVVDYKSKNPNLDVNNLNINQEILNKFETFAQKTLQKYNSKVDDAIKELKNQNYNQEISSRVEQLEQMLNQEKVKFSNLEKQQIKIILQEEFFRHCLNQKTIMDKKMTSDKEIIKAIEILKDENFYNSLLKPQK